MLIECRWCLPICSVTIIINIDLEIIKVAVAPNVEADIIRATFGHKGDVARRIYAGQYVPYSGSNDIFCLTHFSVYGLGVINANRPVNMLTTPEMTISKGVVGYLSISQARLRGIEFWSKVGDRYNNKVVCFDTDLTECFYHFSYADGYTADESLVRAHAVHSSLYSKFMSPLNALAQVKRLIISEDTDDESDIELGIDMDMSVNMEADDESDEFHICDSACEKLFDDDNTTTYGNFFSDDVICQSFKKMVV